ncbi:MAG TPA: FkbM family methyltransferase [Candidatus Acidoferrum sp.]|nr:FkbM family methyltransferase [Candidatus Acidoferrum sp.]
MKIGLERSLRFLARPGRGQRLLSATREAWAAWVRREPYALAHWRWRLDGGDETLRLAYALEPRSVVLDVGGFSGDWAASVVERYRCSVLVFEPIPEHFDTLRKRLGGVQGVDLYPFGLSDRTERRAMAVLGNGSSAFRTSGPARTVRVPLVDIAEFWSDRGLAHVDLLKVNIEGGEFPLLERMLDTGLTRRCANIQVQFHADYPDAVERRESIRARLAKTHELTWDYFFVWENWRVLQAAAGAARREES